MNAAGATHLCCPDCRLRFTRAVAAQLRACPECGRQPQAVSLQGSLGFRVFTLDVSTQPLPLAVAVALAVPDQNGARR